MRYDIHLRSDMEEMIQTVVEEIKDWNGVAETTDKDEIEELAKRVVFFDHCAIPDRPFLIGGADGSGDYPCVKYGDSFVYFSLAAARLYEARTSGILSERSISDHEIKDLLWLSGDSDTCRERFLNAFERMMKETPEIICELSDYYDYKKESGKVPSTRQGLLDNKILILPPAHDASNIGIQLRTVAEVGCLVHLIQSKEIGAERDMPLYLLEDTTMALPMITSRSTLFFEIAKRYACVIAREKGIAYMTLSKSHNMPHMDLIEEIIGQENPSREHWFIRIPSTELKEEKLEFLGKRSIPPVGAISYLFKLHNNTQPMRLDMDYHYWNTHINDADQAQRLKNEIQLFRDLDFASHDQRCYGYPYPIKACHDIASLTEAERLSLRKWIIDRAIAIGLKRKNFVDPEIQTGHA